MFIHGVAATTLVQIFLTAIAFGASERFPLANGQGPNTFCLAAPQAMTLKRFAELRRSRFPPLPWPLPISFLDSPGPSSLITFRRSRTHGT